MPKTREGYTIPQDDHRAQANERFLPFEPDEVRGEYEARGLTDTNNLKLFLRDVPEDVLDLHDYRYRKFAPVIDEFRVVHEEQWDAVQESRMSMHAAELAAMQMDNDRDQRAAEYYALADELKWEYVRTLSEAYDSLAPLMRASGFEPLDVCI